MAMPASVSPHDQFTGWRRGRRSHGAQRDRDARGTTRAGPAFHRRKKAFASLTLITVVAVSLHAGDVFGQVPPAVPTVPEGLPISGAATVGSVTTIQTASPDTRGGNTLNSSIRIDGAFQGSTPTGAATAEPLPLNLGEAVRRGLAYNLGVIGATDVERNARAEQREALARLLPDLS